MREAKLPLALFAAADQETGLDEAGDRGSAGRSGRDLAVPHRARGGTVLARPHGHKRAQHAREGGLRVGGQAGTDLVRVACDRTLELAELVVAREGQDAAALFLDVLAVELIEGEFEQRQGAGLAGRRLLQYHVETLAAFSVLLEAEPGRGRRLPDHLLDLRRVGLGQEIAALVGGKTHQLRQLGGAVVEVAAHHADHPHGPALRQCGNEGQEALARVLVEGGEGEDLLHLVDDEDEAAFGAGIFAAFGRALEARHDGDRRLPGDLAHELAHLLDAETALEKLGQGLRLAGQRADEAADEIALGLARPEDAVPPHADPAHDARRHQLGQDTRAHERGLAAPAHAQDEHESGARGGAAC